MAQDFITDYHDNFKWPYPKPIVARPCDPPKPTTVSEPIPPPIPPYCHCDSHAYGPQIEQYKQLVHKEKQLCEDYEKLKAQLMQVTNDILDHPCDNNDVKMATIYQTDYVRRGMANATYRGIVAACDARAGVPQAAHQLGGGRCYFDPTRFLHTPVVRPRIDPPKYATQEVTPQTIRSWFAEWPGRSEYQDTHSKMGKAIWRSSQRYKEPLPSTRRREDDPCL